MMVWIYKKLTWALVHAELTWLFMLIVAYYYPARARLLRATVLAWAGLVFSPLSQYALIRLENIYPKLSTRHVPEQTEGVIILGGYHDVAASNNRGFPVYGNSAARFLEGLELLKQRPDLKVIVSGKGRDDPNYRSEADLSLQTLLNFGIGKDRIILEGQSLTTSQNAQMTAALLGKNKSRKWLLVTSAFHMKRAALLFKKSGVNILPYPVQYRTANHINYKKLLMFNESLAMYRTVLCEWLGHREARRLPAL